MSDYEVLEIGAVDHWRADEKRFIDKDMHTQFTGVSVNVLEPGDQAPFWHDHSAIEELYFFLEGKGQMALDDQVIDVGPGTVVRVGQNVWRAWRSLPDSAEPLRWLCIRSGGGELSSLPSDAALDQERPFPWS